MAAVDSDTGHSRHVVSNCSNKTSRASRSAAFASTRMVSYVRVLSPLKAEHQELCPPLHDSTSVVLINCSGEEEEEEEEEGTLRYADFPISCPWREHRK
ncbi:uncharacterized protein ACER0C_008835 [Sarotherodon galilaeus]